MRLKSLPWPLAVLMLAILACSGTNSKQGNNSVAVVATPAPTLAPGVKPKYKVEISNYEGVQLVNVTFTGQLPSTDVVDKILRNEFEQIVKKHPGQDALGRAYLGDDDLTENQFSGNLVYKVATKKIMTEDEYNGVKTSTADSASYLLVIEEQHTLEGIKPKKTWLSISLVYPQIPTRDVAYSSMINEIEKLRSRGLDIDSYVKVGDKNKKTSWYQVKDTDGAFIFAGYKADTKQVMRKDKLLKQF